MNNEELKEEITAIAQLQFTSSEIALIVGIEEETLIEKYQQEILKGRLIAEAEVRKSILKSAKEGNTSAQQQFMDMNRTAKRNKSGR